VVAEVSEHQVPSGDRLMNRNLSPVSITGPQHVLQRQWEEALRLTNTPTVHTHLIKVNLGTEKKNLDVHICWSWKFTIFWRLRNVISLCMNAHGTSVKDDTRQTD